MQVDVTQADREAYLAMNMLPEFDAADVRAGLWDKVTGLQAFARHRIQAVRDQADEIARLREALGMAKDLLDCIVQTPGNTWYVSADDPEAAVCDTYSAIDAVLQHKEPQG